MYLNFYFYFSDCQAYRNYELLTAIGLKICTITVGFKKYKSIIKKKKKSMIKKLC